VNLERVCKNLSNLIGHIAVVTRGQGLGLNYFFWSSCQNSSIVRLQYSSLQSSSSLVNICGQGWEPSVLRATLWQLLHWWVNASDYCVAPYQPSLLVFPTNVGLGWGWKNLPVPDICFFKHLQSWPSQVKDKGLKQSPSFNEDKSAASFTARWQPLTWIWFAPFMKWKLSTLPITQQPVELAKNKHRLRILKSFNLSLAQLKNNSILLYKICWQFLVTTELFIGWNILIVLFLCRSNIWS